MKNTNNIYTTQYNASSKNYISISGYSLQLPPGQSESQTSQSPLSSWPFPAHGCSYQSHLTALSDLKSPLQVRKKILINKYTVNHYRFNTVKQI